MTVIAWKGGVLAADTLGVDQGTRIGYLTKIGRTMDGWLFGACGRGAQLAKFAEWMQTREGEPERFDGEHTEFIMIAPGGIVSQWLGEGWFTMDPAEFRAWGSGGELALGAMVMGADAVTACKVACDFNIHCGGEITVIAMDAPPQIVAPPEPDEESIWPDISQFTQEPDTVQAPDWRTERGLA